jgi:nibrin-like protein
VPTSFSSVCLTVNRIKWVSVCLALSYLTKKTLDSGLLKVRQKLELVDIKLSTGFEGGYTTHVVASKRNAPVVLEGLIAGSFIVTDKYIDSIAQACSLSGGSKKAPLEINFDLNWPDPVNYVPLPSKEPVPRDATYLAPKSDRSTLFTNFTFIFCSETQLESLSKPINRGGGKALLYEDYQEGVSTPQEFAAFVRKVAHQSSAEDMGNSSKSVIVVRIQVMEPNEEWKTKFILESDLLLDQRSIAQNEFLDVILTCDTSALQMSLEEDVASSAPPSKYRIWFRIG